MKKDAETDFPLSKGWRTLDERHGGEAVEGLLKREFIVPPGPEDERAGLERREFLKLIGGGLAFAGLSSFAGCTVRPRGEIVPYVRQPEQLVPGTPRFYATALEFRGYGRGFLVETHEGRPTKVEGNPLHPSSLGATSVFEQATLCDLYNPARSSAILKDGEISSWGAFLASLEGALRDLPADGAGLHLLTGATASPSLAALWEEVLHRYPAAEWHRYDPINNDAALEALGSIGLGGVQPLYRFDKAAVVISIGADFLFDQAESLRYARELMHARNGGSRTPPRLYTLESVPTMTGSSSDERRAVAPERMIEYVKALAVSLGAIPEGARSPARDAMQWASTKAEELASNAAGIVIAGDSQPPEIHRLVHLVNERIGAYAQAVIELFPALHGAEAGQQASLKSLVTQAEAGEVKLLLMLGGDWALTAPEDFAFSKVLKAVKMTVHSSLYSNATAEVAQWHIPQAHPFEAWGDTCAADGTAAIIQPLIEPLYGGRGIHELLDTVASFPGRQSKEIIKSYWIIKKGLNEKAWRKALHDGVVEGTALSARSWEASPALDEAYPHLPEGEGSDEELSVLFTPDAGLWDGRHAANPWLQELPKPITKLSWENALLIAPETARRLHLETGEIVTLRGKEGDGALSGMVLVQPGVAPGTFALSFGGGLWPKVRKAGLGRSSRLTPAEEAQGWLGINAYPFRSSSSPWVRTVVCEKSGRRGRLLVTQSHHLVHGRDLLRAGTEDDLRARYLPRPPTPPTLYNLTETMTDGTAWAMSVDLSRCIACNACIVACQAENNIPSVGWEEVGRGREMHWLRLDTYYFGNEEAPFIAHQPVACMHCETAPCELVCPVEATVHDHGGLNVQVYNRCIGTRYCSNNCPYKVRRFNFFRYAEEVAREPLQLMANPNVTIRARGVMEKCTYCVQRISAARIAASREGRAIRDGEVTPACVQVCPTETFIFGNMRDEKSKVAKRKGEELDYALLPEQGTRPRTTYLPRIIQNRKGLKNE